MAKEMVYFNATKQIETITIHYNEKLDGNFVNDVAQSIKDIAQKMSKVNLKSPREFDAINVFVYPSQKLFYKVFAGEIEKRFYSRKRSLEDLYVVQDAEGNIHIVSPRGMAQERRDAFKKILVMKILGEYMEEKEKQSAEKLLKEAMKPKEKEQEEKEVEEIEQDEAQDLEDDETEEQENEQEIETEEEEITEEDVEEIIETELVMEQIDEEQEIEEDEVEETTHQEKEEKRSEAQEWLSIGWLAYVRGKLKKDEDIKRFAANISKKGVKKLGQLSNSRLFESYNYSEEYACALVEYIVETYGMEKFTEFYKNPKDIKGVFGVSKFIFDNQVKAYIYSKYTDKEMLMEMDQKGIDNITEIHFVKSGGVNITSDKEIDEPYVPEKM